MRPIFLVGLMCSGKSTLGQSLARACSLAFADTDIIVEEMAGMPIADIFRAKGEKEFRRIERMALERACCMSDTVVACGGGTACTPGAMELMNAHGTTIYLHACAERLAERMMDGKDKRPLLASARDERDMARMATEMLADRAPHYEKSALRFDSSRLETPMEIEESTRALRLLLCDLKIIP